MKSWNECVEEVHQAVNCVHEDDEDPWFRGHAQSGWLLRSTLHRFVLDAMRAHGSSLSEREQLSMLRNHEKSVYWKYHARAWPHLNDVERNPWGVSFSMRHNGIPSRILDWTHNFACALYFAVNGSDAQGDFAVYVLHPGRLNAPVIGQQALIALDTGQGAGNARTDRWHPHWKREDEDEVLPPIAVMPPNSNARMAAQHSQFVLCGDDFEPLETSAPECVQKIVFPAAVRPDAKRFLRLANLNDPMTYFPDLQGLSMSLQKWHQRILDRPQRP